MPAEPLPPLLPWKLAALALGVLAAWSGWRLDWDPFFVAPAQTLRSVMRLPPREAGRPGLMLLGNSRLGLATDGRLEELQEAAQLEGVDIALVWERELRASELRAGRARLRDWHPSLLIVQMDLLFPLGPVPTQRSAVGRLLSFERQGPDLQFGLELLAQLGAERVWVVDLPVSTSVWNGLGEPYQTDRRACREGLRRHGLDLIAAEQPWPDDLFTDGVHLDPNGSARLRTWLGERLR